MMSSHIPTYAAASCNSQDCLPVKVHEQQYAACQKICDIHIGQASLEAMLLHQACHFPLLHVGACGAVPVGLEGI